MLKWILPRFASIARANCVRDDKFFGISIHTAQILEKPEETRTKTGKNQSAVRTVLTFESSCINIDIRNVVINTGAPIGTASPILCLTPKEKQFSKLWFYDPIAQPGPTSSTQVQALSIMSSSDKGHSEINELTMAASLLAKGHRATISQIWKIALKLMLIHLSGDFLSVWCVGYL